MRRAQRGNRRPMTVPLSLFCRYLIAAANFPTFTCGKVVEDPSHLGYVLRFLDYNDQTHWLEQTNPALQVQMPVAHADYLGQLCVTFTGAQYYTSNKPPAYWNWYNNGAFSGSVVLTQTGGAGANTLIHEASSSFGTQLLFRLNDTQIQFGVYRSASAILNATKAAIGTPQHISMYVDGAASPSISLKSTGNAAATAALPGSSATPDRTFVFGGRAGVPSLGLIARTSVLFSASPNTQAATALREAWINSTYGKAA